MTDNQSAVMRLGSPAACVRLKNRGREPIIQLTCRDRNRIALQSDILTAFSLGVDNMLLLPGDPINLDDHKAAKPGRPVQVVVVVLKSLQMGKFMNKNVSGIQVPQSWIDKADRKKKAAEMTARFIDRVKPMAQGVHIMPWTGPTPPPTSWARPE